MMSGPQIIRTVAEVRQWARRQRPSVADVSVTDVPSGRVSRAVVMTMGALHEGHMALVRAARQRADEVIVTIFVNPLQFGPGEDFDAYPRTEDADVALLAREQVDAVFVPSVADMYPGGDPLVRVTAGELGRIYEGAARPGHFDGMLTVVAKLLVLTAPDVAFFGEKDAQQLLLIKRMVKDLSLDVEIAPVPLVREDSGLALSSRNAYLSPTERSEALALSRALLAASQVAAAGGRAPEILAAGRAVFANYSRVDVDYFALVDPDTMAPLADDYCGVALALVAARVGRTRLIDNMSFVITQKQ